MSVVENDLAAEKGQFAVNIFDVGGGDRVEIAIPDGDVGVFAGFERADAVFEEELVRGPDGVGLERGVDVDGFGGAERLLIAGGLRTTEDQSP